MANSRKSNEWLLKENFGLNRNEPRGKKTSGAPTPRASAFIGFVLVVAVVGLLGTLLSLVLQSAGVVAWRVSLLEGLQISAILVALRAIDRAVFGAIEQARRDK